MWQVDNHTPFTTLGYFVRDKNGAEHWCIAVRACFDIRSDGLLAVSEKQEPVRLAPVYTDETSSELSAESDFAPFRPHADILLAGKATALGGRHFDSQPIRVSVGKLSKTAIAIRPRQIVKRKGVWEISEQCPVDAVPLLWKNSLGGIDNFVPDGSTNVCEENPVGKGWSLHLHKAKDGATVDLPQIENPNTRVHPRQRMPAPVGFGPLQPSWPHRLRWAGTYDDTWRNQRAPLLPLDFKETFHQAAPPDQIYPDTLRGGEPVSVDGLHPDGPYTFRLPQAILEAKTTIGTRRITHRFRIVSVTIDATAKKLDMTWNANTPCPGVDHLVDGSLVMVRQIAGVAR